jgi:hypothetical protein
VQGVSVAYQQQLADRALNSRVKECFHALRTAEQVAA